MRKCVYDYCSRERLQSEGETLLPLTHIYPPSKHTIWELAYGSVLYSKVSQGETSLPRPKKNDYLYIPCNIHIRNITSLLIEGWSGLRTIELPWKMCLGMRGKSCVSHWGTPHCCNNNNIGTLGLAPSIIN